MEMECLAVFWALQILRNHLQGHHFIAHSDQAALRFLMNINNPSGRLMRWILIHSEFGYEVQYKNGLINTKADAVSCLLTSSETNQTINKDVSSYLVIATQTQGIATF